VFNALTAEEGELETECETGMATGAALFRLRGGSPRRLTVSVPLGRELKKMKGAGSLTETEEWPEALEGAARLQIPDARLVFLFDAAVRTLVLLCLPDIFPGPYTYRRFWFRDACLMLHALLCLGLERRSRRCIALFQERQQLGGYFYSQSGEWDSNGQVLWLYARYRRLTGERLEKKQLAALRKGADWILGKRVKAPGKPLIDGLLPPGFSAEHFGPNDYYYWDDFWAVAGLQSAASLLAEAGDGRSASRFGSAAADMQAAVFRSIAATEPARRRHAIPASPHRRLDAGAIGSLVADYPLQITPPGDAAIMNTLGFLLDTCLQKGGFFQDIIHSGINAYLTLAMAQTLLRAGDARCWQLIDSVADLASPTGQWPEAIHPRTGGGCMGDGQHGWAAAEWVMMMRNLFVREEGASLVIGSGVRREWLREGGKPVSFGPTPTPWGRISVILEGQESALKVSWSADWRQSPPEIDICVSGFERLRLDAGRAEKRQTVEVGEV